MTSFLTQGAFPPPLSRPVSPSCPQPCFLHCLPADGPDHASFASYTSRQRGGVRREGRISKSRQNPSPYVSCPLEPLPARG